MCVLRVLVVPAGRGGVKLKTGVQLGEFVDLLSRHNLVDLWMACSAPESVPMTNRLYRALVHGLPLS